MDEQLRKSAIERIESVEAKAVKLAGLSASLGQKAQFLADAASASKEAMKNQVPQELDIEDLYTTWQRADENVGTIHSSITELAADAVLSSAGSAVAYSMTPFIHDLPIPSIEDEAQSDPELRPRLLLRGLIDRMVDHGYLLDLLQQFRLDRAPEGQKSPIDLFQTAWSQLEAPFDTSSHAATSLLMAREAIQVSIEQLLRQRPHQERAGPDRAKIQSIGRQLARPGIQPEDIDVWADHWITLNDELSGSKDKDISRDRWHNLLRKASIFLKELLEGLDQTKLRRRN